MNVDRIESGHYAAKHGEFTANIKRADNDTWQLDIRDSLNAMRHFSADYDTKRAAVDRAEELFNTVFVADD